MYVISHNYVFKLKDLTVDSTLDMNSSLLNESPLLV